MADSMSFKEDRKVYEEELELAQAELERLEAELSEHEVQTQRCRETIKKLRDVMSGKRVSVGRSRGSRIKSLRVNPDTGRPSRGKRREQIKMVSKKLGRGKKTFRTVDVLNELREVESDFSTGIKSYTYAVMNSLQEDGFIEKVGRGTWKLK